VSVDEAPEFWRKGEKRNHGCWSDVEDLCEFAVSSMIEGTGVAAVEWVKCGRMCSICEVRRIKVFGIHAHDISTGSESGTVVYKMSKLAPQDCVCRQNNRR
jgi:hypothetical protein